MARTRLGNLTGRAATTQRYEDWSKRVEENLKEAQRAQTWEDTEYWPNVELLKTLDPNFEEWFWAQPEQTKGEILPVIKRRIQEILKDIHEKEHDRLLEIQQMLHPY